MPIEAAARYNEIDAHAAAWLRNLIGLGELPHGEVDERSIVDVRGDDLAGCDEVHLFAGIGVWARAVAEAERASNYRLARPLFTGSCPCQPLSAAGQRKGHVDERHLWPAFHRLIAERRPATILGEQVASKDGREWMAAVRHDLKASGYAVGTAILPAGGFGAPHIRYRLFFVADAQRAGLAQRQRNGGVPRRTQGADAWQAFERGGPTGALGHADFAGRQALDLQPKRAGERSGQFEEPSLSGGVADAARERQQYGDIRGGDKGMVQRASGGNQQVGIERAIMRPRHPDSFCGHADWIFCRDNKWRPIEPGSFPLVDGSAFRLGSGGPFEGMSRAGMLRGYGNAVVLPVARAFVECAMEAVNAH